MIIFAGATVSPVDCANVSVHVEPPVPNILVNAVDHVEDPPPDSGPVLGEDSARKTWSDNVSNAIGSGFHEPLRVQPAAYWYQAGSREKIDAFSRARCGAPAHEQLRGRPSRSLASGLRYSV